MSLKPWRVAEAVKELVNGATLPMAVTARRTHMEEYARNDMGSTVNATVIPLGRSTDIQSRGGVRSRDIDISIVVSKVVATATRDADIDDLMDLMDAIQEAMWSTGLVGDIGEGMENARLVGCGETLVQSDSLDRLNQFTGALTATYRVVE